MSKFVIIVEGCADAVFLNDLIYSILPEGCNEFKNLKKFKKGPSIKIQNSPHIEILIAGGCTQIKNYHITIREFLDAGYKVLMIQDADNPVKEKNIGGVAKRTKYLNDIQAELQIKFSTFLFPNNHDDGDLEDILLAIANQKKYAPFHVNYSQYSNNVKSFAVEKHADELLESKFLVYNYCQVYHGTEKSKESGRFYRNEYWDLKHVALQTLIDFLKAEVGIV